MTGPTRATVEVSDPLAAVADLSDDEESHSLDNIVRGVFGGTLDSAAADIVSLASAGCGGYIVMCNLHVLMSAQRDREVLRAVTGATYVMPDGAPIAWLKRRRGTASARRIAGADLMGAVIDAGASQGLRHLFLGSTDDVLAALVPQLNERHPGARIVATCNPGVGTADDLAAAASVVRREAVDIVWVALGAPKQELWMAAHAAAFAPAVAVGVGAAFEFHAGTRRRAPRLLQRSGLEWAYRLAREPRRLSGRYLWTSLAFLRFLLSPSREG